MIDAVSNVSFRGEAANAQDLINAPGKFTSQAPLPAAAADSFERADGEEKKSGNGLAVAIGTALVALAAFAGLGYAVRKGHIEKVDVSNVEGFFNKALARIKNAAAYIGEKANVCYDSTLGKWFGKEVTDAAKAEEAVAEAAAEA